MADRPILFSAPMIKALLAGRKTQTRRIAKVKPGTLLTDLDQWEPLPDGTRRAVFRRDQIAEPRIAVGDRLWVRERFAYKHDIPKDKARDQRWYGVVYEADGEPSGFGISDLKPAIFMPRWASRLTLTVTDVRVERLQDISPYDALVEGVCSDEQDGDAPDQREINAYAALWDSINGAGAWDTNPWIVAYSFMVHHANIDQMAKEAA